MSTEQFHETAFTFADHWQTGPFEQLIDLDCFYNTLIAKVMITSPDPYWPNLMDDPETINASLDYCIDSFSEFDQQFLRAEIAFVDTMIEQEHFADVKDYLFDVGGRVSDYVAKLDDNLIPGNIRDQLDAMMKNLDSS